MIKQYNYAQSGAPVLTARPDSLITLLNAVLVDGYNTVNLTSITIADDVAAVVTATAHKFVVGDVVAIAGCTDTSGTGGQDFTPLNADQVVVTADDNTHFTFATTGLTNGVVSGASKTAGSSSLGFTKPYSTSHVAVYRSGDSGGKQDYLRVDDTNATYALVRAYTAMSGHSTGTGPYPTTVQTANGFQWFKGEVSDGDSLSISSLVVAGGIATATTTADHNLISRNKVTVSGSTPSSLNGVKKVTVRGPRKFQYATVEADATASGTITAIKSASRKWYLYGDTKGFHLFIEIGSDVYGLCEFGDINSYRTANKNSLIGGILGDAYYACTALGGTTLHHVGTKKNAVIPATGIFRTASTKTSSITLPALDITDSLEEANVLVGTTKTGTLRGFYVNPYRSGVNYSSATSSDNKPYGADSDTVVAFQTIAGSPSYVTNVFVQTSGSW